jgi:hypothetical protein
MASDGIDPLRFDRLSDHGDGVFDSAVAATWSANPFLD